MSEFPNPQRSLCEAAMEVRLGKKVVYSERNDAAPQADAEDTTGTPEGVVYEYLSSYFGVDLNESIDELTEEHLEEAIESLNILCATVNEYFGLYEGDSEDIAALHKQGDKAGIARIYAARKAENMPMGQAGKYVRNVVSNAAPPSPRR